MFNVMENYRADSSARKPTRLQRLLKRPILNALEIYRPRIHYTGHAYWAARSTRATS